MRGGGCVCVYVQRDRAQDSSAGRHRTQDGGRKRYSLLLPPHRLAGTSPLLSCPPSGMYAIGSPGSQAFELGLNDISSFPESLTCRRQTARLLGLRNQVSQFLKTDLLLYTYY